MRLIGFSFKEVKAQWLVAFDHVHIFKFNQYIIVTLPKKSQYNCQHDVQKTSIIKI
jgi:hypothetical protein